MDIQSIYIVQVFLTTTNLLKMTYLVKSHVQLIMVALVLPNSIHDLLPSIKHMLVGFPLFQCISSCTEANVGQWWFLIPGLSVGEIVIQLKNLSFLVLHMASEFRVWCYFPCYHFLLVVWLSLGGWR